MQFLTNLIVARIFRTKTAQISMEEYLQAKAVRN